MLGWMAVIEIVTCINDVYFVDVAASQLELTEGQLCERKDTHSVWLVWLLQHGIMFSLLYYLSPDDLTECIVNCCLIVQ